MRVTLVARGATEASARSTLELSKVRKRRMPRTVHPPGGNRVTRISTRSRRLLLLLSASLVVLGLAVPAPAAADPQTTRSLRIVAAENGRTLFDALVSALTAGDPAMGAP